MADTNRGRSRQIAYLVVIVAAAAVLVLALLNPRPTALTWVEVGLAALLALGAGYLLVRGRRTGTARRVRTHEDATSDVLDRPHRR